MALAFGGDADQNRVTTPFILDPSATNFTFEAWVKPFTATSATSYNRIIEQYPGTGTRKTFLALQMANNDYRIYTNTTGTYMEAAEANPANVWVHAALTWDGTTLRLYRNGLLANSQTPGPISSATGGLLFGASQIFTNGYMEGMIDEIRVWSVARSEAELRSTMYRSLDGDENGLEAYYRFDQQADAGNLTAYDQTANAHHGTLTNMDPATDWVASNPFNTWIGSEDSDWSNADNWGSNVVPTTEDVGLYHWVASHAPASANISARNFYLADNVAVSHSGNLTLSGDFYNAGTFTTTSTVTFSGSVAQAIRGAGSSTFGTLTINNAAGVSMEQDLSVTSSLTLTSGSFSIGAHTLSLDGDLSIGSGSLVAGSTSSLTVTGAGTALQLPALTLEHLSLNRGTGILLDGPLQLEGVLTLTNGVIDLDGSSLSFGPSASVAGSPDANAHLDATSGSIVKEYAGVGSFSYPVGDGTYYSPITLHFGSGTFSTASASVGLTATKHPQNGSSTDYLNRYWTVNSSGITAFSCDVTAQYVLADVSGDNANLSGGKFSGGTWLDLGPVDAGNRLVTGSVNSFSDFTAGEPAAFPVEWLGFEATALLGQVQLDWLTASEQNSHYFAVERSRDGLGWATLGQVPAAGQSDVPRSYRFLDPKPLSGLQFYRLRQVDFDGRHGYSEVRSVSLETTVSVYPNPVRDLLHLDLPGMWSIELADLNGRVLTQQKGQDHGSVSLEALPAGLYVLQVKGSGSSHKMMIRKE